MQIDDRAARCHPLFCRGCIDLGVGGILDIRRQNRAVRQQGPAFLGVEVALALRAQCGPFQSLWIKFSHLLGEFVPHHKLAIRQHDRRRISDVIPVFRRRQRGPLIGCGIVDRSQVGKGKASVVVFTARYHQSPVGQDRRSEIVGHISSGKAGDLRPDPVHIASSVVGRELPPVGGAISLRQDCAVSQLECELDSVRRLMPKRFDCLCQRGAGHGEQNQ